MSAGAEHRYETWDDDDFFFDDIPIMDNGDDYISDIDVNMYPMSMTPVARKQSWVDTKMAQRTKAEMSLDHTEGMQLSFAE